MLGTNMASAGQICFIQLQSFKALGFSGAFSKDSSNHGCVKSVSAAGRLADDKCYRNHKQILFLYNVDKDL